MASSHLEEDLLKEMCSGSLRTVKGIRARLKADPTIHINWAGMQGITPLEVAIIHMYDSQEIVRFLLSKGAVPIVAGTEADQSPLMTACQKGCKDIAKGSITWVAIFSPMHSVQFFFLKCNVEAEKKQ